MDKKLEKLNKLIALVQNDTLRASDIESFLKVISELIKTERMGFQKVSQETLLKVAEALETIKKKHSDIISTIDQKNEELLKKFTPTAQELKSLIDEIENLRPVDGKTPIKGVDYFDGVDGKDGLDGSPDSPEDIKVKLESLTGDDRLDAKAIKNLPKGNTIVGGGSRNIYQLDDVKLTSIANNDILKYNSISRKWENGTASGGGTPGGSDTQLQYNNAGTFGGVSTLTYNNSTDDLVFNDSAGDNDFRMEGQTDQNLFFLDASTDRIGIGTSTPASKLDVTKDSIGTAINIANGISLINNTSATSILQQNSPPLRFRGNGWKSNATAQSQTLDLVNWIYPINSGASAVQANGAFRWQWSINGSSITSGQFLDFWSDGFLCLGVAGPFASSSNKLQLAGGINLTSGSFQLNGNPGGSGQVMVSNGSGNLPSWINPTLTPAGGSDQQIQFNDGGSSFGGDAGFTYNKTTDVATVGGIVTSDIHTVNANSGTTISILAGSAVSGDNTGGTINITSGVGSGINENGSLVLEIPNRTTSAVTDTIPLSSVLISRNKILTVTNGGNNDLAYYGSIENYSSELSSSSLYGGNVVIKPGQVEVTDETDYSLLTGGTLYLYSGGVYGTGSAINSELSLSGGQWDGVNFIGGGVDIVAGGGDVNGRILLSQPDAQYDFFNNSGGVTGILDFASVNTSNKTFTFPNITGVLNTTKSGRATGQTAANTSVATTTVGTSDGSFRISANVLVTTSTTHNFTVTCDYTDEGNTARTITFNFQNVGGTIATAIANAGGAVPYHGIPLHIRAKASTAITIKTTGTFTTVTYNVEGAITQIA